MSDAHKADPVVIGGARFPLGRLVATPGAIYSIDPGEISNAVRRHASGDWGELPAEDAAENERSLVHGWRLLSVYRSTKGTRYYVITEADRSVTTVLLPEEY